MGKLWKITVIVLMAMHCINSRNMYASNCCDIIEYTAERNDKSYISTELADMEGYVKIFNFASPRIVSDILIIKDSSAFFRTQSHSQYFGNTYTQVELDIKVANKISRLLNEIYLCHESVIRPDLPEVPIRVFSESYDCWIELTIDGKLHKEYFDIIDYDITYMELEIDPFYKQFKEICLLLYAISYRMEHEFYDFEYNRIDKKRMEENQALGRLYDPESVVQGHL